MRCKETCLAREGLGLVKKLLGFIVLLIILAILVQVLLGINLIPKLENELKGLGASTTSSACSTTPPTVQTIQTDTAYDNMFNAYGNQTNGQGWSGGDGAYSVMLPGGEEVWLFSDTLFGTVANGQRSVSAFIHNSLVTVQNGAITGTLYNYTSPPKGFVTPAGASSTTPWFWLSSGVVNGNSLQIIMPEFRNTGSGAFDFAWMQTYIGTFSLPSMTLESVQPVPSAASYGIVWSSWALSSGGYTYVYGYNNNNTGGNVNMYVARVSGTNLLGQWEYYSAGGWSASPASASSVMSGLPTGYSVTPLGSYYLLVSMNPGAPFSGQIMAYFSCSPTGPFLSMNSGKPIYTTPEQGEYSSEGGAWTYDAFVHPELSGGNTLFLSYSVNGFNSTYTFQNPSIYRPRFLLVTLST